MNQYDGTSSSFIIECLYMCFMLSQPQSHEHTVESAQVPSSAIGRPALQQYGVTAKKEGEVFIGPWDKSNGPQAVHSNQTMQTMNIHENDMHELRRASTGECKQIKKWEPNGNDALVKTKSTA